MEWMRGEIRSISNAENVDGISQNLSSATYTSRKEEKTLSAKIVSPKSDENSQTQNVNKDYVEGFLRACTEIKDILSASHQDVCDAESHQLIDRIWAKIKVLENEKNGRPSILEGVEPLSHDVPNSDPEAFSGRTKILSLDPKDDAEK